LSNEQILNFVKKYQLALSKLESLPQLKSIIFCGGEVFILPNFPDLINQLIDQNIFITIITNGTIDKLDEIRQPADCQLIVSFDGPKQIHDQNRGTGNYALSKAFVKKALKLGFPVEIFYLITKDSYPFKDKLNIFNLHKTYLTDRLGSLTPQQVAEIRNNYDCYPPKNFGCNIFSLQSDGKFYGCCESTLSIGSLSDPLKNVINKYIEVTTKFPKCSDPKFFCGFKN